MRINMDTETGAFEVSSGGAPVRHPLFSEEAFRILSRLWMTLGWNLGHWKTLSWMGRQLLQFPDDVLRLAELFWDIRPDVIVETGVYDGGSTLLFASLCRLHGRGRVISIDCGIRAGVRDAIMREAGGLVSLLEGDSASPTIAAMVRRQVAPGERVCLFLDSGHSTRHVLAELRSLAPLVSPGCYAIVADSILPDLAMAPEGESGWTSDHPGIAVGEFLREHPEFTRNRPAPRFRGSPAFEELSYFSDTWLLRTPDR